MRNLEKVAERRVELERQLRLVDSGIERHEKSHAIDVNNPSLYELGMKRHIILHELETMEPKPCPPSETEILRAEVQRLEAEVERLRNAVQLGLHPTLLEAK